jgi:hypothetical protein
MTDLERLRLCGGPLCCCTDNWGAVRREGWTHFRSQGHRYHYTRTADGLQAMPSQCMSTAKWLTDGCCWTKSGGPCEIIHPLFGYCSFSSALSRPGVYRTAAEWLEVIDMYMPMVLMPKDVLRR